jgi:mono/diheme cytochrome c family protein
MKRHHAATCAAILGTSLATLLLTASAAAADAVDPATIARGEYLVNSSGCHLCHTPKKMGSNGPEPDMSRMLSGHPASLQLPPPPQLPPGQWTGLSAASGTAWSGPWGVSHSANLTPDMETGLGRWTLRDFIDTIRTGRRMGRGRKVLPPMPVSAYRNLDDQDLAAIYAYLQSIPAIANAVPEPLARGMTAAGAAEAIH